MKTSSIFKSSSWLFFLCIVFDRYQYIGCHANGGGNCAACTIIVALVEQLADIHQEEITDTLERVCSFLPRQFVPTCDTAVEFLGPFLVELVEQGAGPDAACHALKFCFTEPGHATCTTFKPPFESHKGLSFDEKVLKARLSINHLLKERPLTGNICELPGIKEICKLLDRALDDQEPVLDLDNDGFSNMFALRGRAWRGRDCSDEFSSVHPGAIPLEGDKEVDSNCNGISGINNKTQRTYEDELCSDSQPKGVAVLGDSIAAHFHLPPQWFDATLISEKAFEHVITVLENEYDWPMMSTVTGYGTNNWTEIISGPIDSIYMRMRKRNRCNHRDYQNLSVNGMSSENGAETAKRFARHPEKDRPLILFVMMVGNDVCNGNPDTLAHMTSPESMYNNTIRTLNYLNKVLPKGSDVILTGLADGRILYDSMGHRIHPLGTHWGQFTYTDFYNFFGCLGISPCLGWLSTNATLRNLTTERANELSDVLRNIAKKFKNTNSNFDLYFIDNPIKEAIRKWEQKGGSPWQLIEPVDGFHNNQICQALTTQVIWDTLNKMNPSLFGPTNPHNDLIGKLFGDQNGY